MESPRKCGVPLTRLFRHGVKKKDNKSEKLQILPSLKMNVIFHAVSESALCFCVFTQRAQQLSFSSSVFSVFSFVINTPRLGSFTLFLFASIRA